MIITQMFLIIYLTPFFNIDIDNLCGATLF